MSRTIEEMEAAGYEHVGEDRDTDRRTFQEDGERYYLTDAENAARDAEEEAEGIRQADYKANLEYIDERRVAYPPIGDQLDAIWKQLNQDRLGGKELIQEVDDQLNKVLAVKVAHPKP